MCYAKDTILQRDRRPRVRESPFQNDLLNSLQKRVCLSPSPHHPDDQMDGERVCRFKTGLSAARSLGRG